MVAARTALWLAFLWDEVWQVESRGWHPQLRQRECPVLLHTMLLHTLLHAQISADGSDMFLHTLQSLLLLTLSQSGSS